MSTLIPGVIHPPDPTDVPMEPAHSRLASLRELCADCTFGDVRMSWSIQEKENIKDWREKFIQTFKEAFPSTEELESSGYGHGIAFYTIVYPRLALLCTRFSNMCIDVDKTCANSLQLMNNVKKIAEWNRLDPLEYIASDEPFRLSQSQCRQVVTNNRGDRVTARHIWSEILNSAYDISGPTNSIVWLKSQIEDYLKEYPGVPDSELLRQHVRRRSNMLDACIDALHASHTESGDEDDRWEDIQPQPGI